MHDNYQLRNKENYGLFAVGFNFYQESRYHHWNINYIACACNKLMTSDPLPKKKLSGSGRFGKVAKIAWGGVALLVPSWRRLQY